MGCSTCGACCSYSRDWPRFTIEDDLAIDRIPRELVHESLSGMRCNGSRCSALAGQIGVRTSCIIYDDRPEVCRACEPGDDACRLAREKFGLPSLADRPLSDEMIERS